MSRKYYENKLREAEKNYFSVEKVSCPALNNEMIYFDKKGFRHLIRKGRKLRETSDQLRRFALIPYIQFIIKTGREISDRRKTFAYNSEAEFITIGIDVEKRKIKIILRRLNDGKLCFFSIMD